MANNGNTENGVLQVDEMGKVPRAKKELKDQIEFHCCALGGTQGEKKSRGGKLHCVAYANWRNSNLHVNFLLIVLIVWPPSR